MYAERKKYKYNYWGLFLSKWRVRVRSGKGNRFYCSEFVKACLECFNIANAKELPKIIKPIDFLKLNNKNIIYTGLLQNYAIV